jgi:sphinganine-1-phosphate aldolase
MTLPATGRTADDILGSLEVLRHGDVRWREGRAFSLAYYAGPDVHALANAALAAFSSENALNVDAFPSLRRMQNDVVSNVCELLGGDESSVGVFTSGGTESILTAVDGARNWGIGRGISCPEIVLPTTAHAAFTKAATYFGLTSIRVPVRPDYRADPDAIAAAVTPSTVMIVGSAPSYPQGVIDPIAELGAIAEEFDLLFHVDACMGFTLPWLERLGLVDVPWNFRVPAVTSMSCDLHKYGYTAKGASVLAHRSKDLRRHQFFRTDDWLGGLYGSPAILGTRSGGPLAAAWAVMQYLGEEGYLRLTSAAYDARRRLQRRVEAIDGLGVRGEPETTLIAFGAAATDQPPLDIYAVADELWTRHGWYCDRQTPPDSLHCTINAVHAPLVDEFADDLAAIVDDLRVGGARVGGARVGDRTKAYGTIE